MGTSFIPHTYTTKSASTYICKLCPEREGISIIQQNEDLYNNEYENQEKRLSKSGNTDRTLTRYE
jgi:hypothetical protein